MSGLSLLVLALGLAMDAVAASVACSVAKHPRHVRRALLIGLVFGTFQGGMPLFGFLLGAKIGPAVQRWDHWIAFVLLAAIGGKMLFEAFKRDEEEARAKGTELTASILVTLGFATSIDAFAVGVTLPLLKAPLLASIVTIGATTAALSASASLVARAVGHHLGKRLDVAGGLFLVGLGAKILYEHLRDGI